MFRQIGELGEQEEQMDIKRVWEELEKNKEEKPVSQKMFRGI